MSAQPSAADQEAVESLEAANSALYAAVETGDFDAMTAMWVDGAYADSSVCVHPGWPAVVGRGQVMRAWALIMANTTYIQFFLTDVHAWVVDDLGIVSCQENILTGMDSVAGDGSGDFSGGRVVATNVFRRTPQGWRAWLHHASPVLAVDDGDPDDDSGASRPAAPEELP